MKNEPLYADLRILQPSQLYISAPRLQAILSWLEKQNLSVLEPLPVKLLQNRLVLTDGHHRALAMHLIGLSQAAIIWDEDDLDWEAYQICVDWCLKEGIKSVPDLEKRIISPSEFSLLWEKRCDDLHAMLKEKRCASD